MSDAMKSWIEISPNCDFSLVNIPFGVASKISGSAPRCCTAIGDYAVDLSLLAEAGLFHQVEEECAEYNFSAVSTFANTTLNQFMSYPKPVSNNM